MPQDTSLDQVSVLIKNCFGENDSTFCSHVLDEKRAEKLLSTARENGITLKEIIIAASTYLKSKGVNEEKLEIELRKVKSFFILSE